MSSNGPTGPDAPAATEPSRADEAPMSRWQKLRLVIKVVELRLQVHRG